MTSPFCHLSRFLPWRPFVWSVLEARKQGESGAAARLVVDGFAGDDFRSCECCGNDGAASPDFRNNNAKNTPVMDLMRLNWLAGMGRSLNVCLRDKHSNHVLTRGSGFLEAESESSCTILRQTLDTEGTRW